MINVLQYGLLILWLAYMIFVARSMHRLEKERLSKWDKRQQELITTLRATQRINTAWEKELNTWRTKREQLEDAINKRDELLNKKRSGRRR